MKKLVLIAVVLLIGCDISLLFAAEGNVDPEGQRQLQLQQKQLQALQQLGSGGAASPPPTNNLSGAAPSSVPSSANGNGGSNNALPEAQPSQTLPPPSSISNVTGSTQPRAQLPSLNDLPSTPPGFTAADANPAASSQAQNTQLQTMQAQEQAQLAQVARIEGGGSVAGSSSPESVSRAAFNSTAQAALPMTPDQIVRLRQLFSASQLAASTSPTTPPRPTATSQYVNLAPGATPPVIRLAQGFVTSLVFVDSTGAPWPIQAYDIGNPSAFNIQWNKTDNTLMLQALTLYTYGNLAVRLKGLVTPVMLTLTPGQQAVDYRVDLRVQGVGPNATTAPIGDGLPSAASGELLGVLDGLPPNGSKILAVTGGDAQAWLVGEKLYVRTRLVILSPGWIATMSSADGMRAYEMQKTPMLLVSQNGKVSQLKIEGL